MNAPAPEAPHLPRETWESYLADDLNGAARHRVESHLAECAGCTAWVARTDASHLFHRLNVPVPEPAWDGFWEGIQPGLVSRPRRRERLLVAGGVAAALGLVALVAMIGRGPRQGGIATGATVRRDPCEQASLATNLKHPMTREECLALYGEDIRMDEHAVEIVGASVDLRGL